MLKFLDLRPVSLWHHALVMDGCDYVSTVESKFYLLRPPNQKLNGIQLGALGLILEYLLLDRQAFLQVPDSLSDLETLDKRQLA